MRRFAIVIKQEYGVTQPVYVEAEDVDVECAGEEERGRPIDYNFLVFNEDIEEDESVARIPFDHVLYIAKV